MSEPSEPVATTSVNTEPASTSGLPEAHTAAKAGNVEILESLPLEALETAASDGSFPIHWAASSNAWRATKFLAARTNVNALGPVNTTALHWAVRAGYVYTAHLLLEAGADAAARDSEQYTPLHIAVHSSNVLMVIYLLHTEQPSDPNARDASGKTPLHWAAYQGDHLSVKALIKAGADPNARDNDGFIALHWALVSRSKGCIEQLVEAQSDLTLTTNAGKTCAVISEEMDSVHEWHAALLQVGRLPSGSVVKQWFSRTTANWILFLLPFVLCPVEILLLIRFWPAAFVLAYAVKKFCDWALYPCIQGGPGALVISTALAGIYNSMFVWIFAVYFAVVLPATWERAPIANGALCILGVSVLAFYIYAAAADPGIVKAGDIAQRRAVIFALLDQGLYDGDHFDVNTWAPKPARAQYSRHMNAVVARFDHYCPWVYNAIGLKNHRSFMCYVTCLSAALGFYFYLYLLLAESLGPLPRSALELPFTSLMSLGIFFQGCWIVLLTLTQYVQIARGLTTSEFQHGPSFSFTSLPRDHPLAAQRPAAMVQGGQGAAAEADAEHAKHKHARRSTLTTCLKLLGVSQAVETSRRARNNKLGVYTNCTDFWCVGWNVFSGKGEGRQNGKPVDYMVHWDQTTQPPAAHAGTALRSLV